VNKLLTFCFALIGIVSPVCAMTAAQEKLFQTPHAPREELRLNANKLGPVTESPGFWLRLIDDSNLKEKHDPEGLFTSDWHRHYREMFASEGG